MLSVHTTPGRCEKRVPSWCRHRTRHNRAPPHKPIVFLVLLFPIALHQLCLLHQVRAEKRNNHLPFSISARGSHEQGNQMIVVKRKAGVFKFSQFEERFRKAPFSRQISVDGRRASVFKFLRRSVDRPSK